MGNSPLVTDTRLSPHFNPRNHAIDTVTIHCVVGQCTAKTVLNFDRFDLEDADNDDASCNYVVGCDGSIGLCVEEKNRSWCTSNRDNDHRAITIEVASGTKHPYEVTDAAYKALINLLVDICQRNPGIGTLKWKGDKSLIGQPDKQNMTVHRWFANKACPGEWLYSRHAQIAAEVNARLTGGSTTEPAIPTPAPTPSEPTTPDTSVKFKAGDLVSLTADAKYYNGTDVPNWVLRKRWYVKRDANGDRVVINKSEDGRNAINSPVHAKYLKLVQPKPEVPYLVQVSISDLQIRKGPGTNYGKRGVTGKGVFTIVEVQNGAGSNTGWGLLKAYQTSRSGWVSLDYCKKV